MTDEEDTGSRPERSATLMHIAGYLEPTTYVIGVVVPFVIVPGIVLLARSDLVTGIWKGVALTVMCVVALMLSLFVRVDIFDTMTLFTRERGATPSALSLSTAGRFVADRSRLRELNAKIEERQREADRLEKIIENYRQQASNEFRQVATDLLGEEAAATVAGHYSYWADELTRRYRRTRRAAVAVLVTGSLLVTGLLLYGASRDFDAQVLVAKVTVSVPFGVAYALLYVESVQYRREALVAANISVQMRSVAAYTIWLDQESKNAVRRKLGEAIFVGPPAHLLHEDKPPETPPLAPDLLLRIIDALVPRPLVLPETRNGAGRRTRSAGKPSG
jgi:hypothetical protein